MALPQDMAAEEKLCNPVMCSTALETINGMDHDMNRIRSLLHGPLDPEKV